ncbi:cytochrome P450 family protein [Cercophora newfieldiana]|uniref:Cytochrome P450 family protein n=1 Tax=Cercophora newfieldiana TaxID=92897 RepID=A0AA40CPZ1_9PEZI|nr:cytochrome P450 family protein [Cercophora newfieldiana]
MAWQLDFLTAFATVATLLVFYVSFLVFQRLVLSPLANFPGPRLAALTNWYEFYYDVILQGKFTSHIQQLHKQYGPIVRITPTELHIDDPDYFDTLYSRSGRRDKYSYFANRFGGASDSFSTVHHDTHRLRRKAISPFFSGSNIQSFQPVIRSKVAKFCYILATQYAAPDHAVVPLSRAWMALTTDVITSYAFATSYDQLDSPDFVDTLHDALVAIYVTGHFALHFPIVFPILDRLPDWFVRAAQPDVLPVVGLRKDLARRIREIREGRNTKHREAAHPTIFHELLGSDLPEEEKKDARLGDEAQLIVAAGLITTSGALTVGGFHLISNPEMVAKLRDEVRSVEGEMDWHVLERLPYLRGCVHESIRLSHGIVTRDPRIAPEEELRYREWRIPAGTPVSMTTVDVLMNAEIFPEPERFRPERWMDNPGLERYFVPFGKGSRQCLGINLAMAELYITFATVFSRFDFELFETDESDVRMEHAYLVPYPKWESKGVRVVIKGIL